MSNFSYLACVAHEVTSEDHEWVFWLIMGPVAVVGFTILGGAMWHLRSADAYEKLMRPRDKRPS